MRSDLADAVLILHAAFVLFVVLGLALVIAGGVRGWSWVRNPWFRAGHLAAIGVVVAESWLGIACPLTTAEMSLRMQAGADAYSDGFLAHWVHALLYYHAPPSVFTAAYTVFAACVLASWVFIRPRRFSARPESARRAARGRMLAPPS